MKLLITYGSQYGSTKSIAERIQAKIAAANIGEITLEPVEKKLSIDAFGNYTILSNKPSMEL